MAEEQGASLHFNDYWRVIKNRWPIVLIVFVLVVATAYFVTDSMDKIYSASAVVKVDKENKDVEVFRAANDQFEPIFFQTEFEIIQSSQVLDPVIEKMQLRERFCERNKIDPAQLSKNAFYNIFKRGFLKAQPYRNTKLIEIVAYSVDPQEAADIANAIASQYQEYRLGEITGKSKEGLDTLREEFEKQKKLVETAKKKVDELAKQVDSTTSLTGSGTQISTLGDIAIQQKETLLTEAKTDYTQRKVRYDKIKNLTIEELENVLNPIGLMDANISSLKQSYLTLQSDLSRLRLEGYQDNHPTVQAAVAQINKVRAQLNSLIEGLKNGLSIDLSVAEAKIKSIEEELVLMKERNQTTRSGVIVEYEEAKRQYDIEQSMFEVIFARYKQMSIDENINVKPVQLIDAAAKSEIPTKPNMKLNLALATAVGLVLGISLAFFIEYLDTSVKSLDDVERFLNTTVVGVIPEGVSTLNLEGPDSPNAEAYRILRAKIDLQAKGDGATSVTLVSGGPGEGKSTTCFNLAYVCAYSGMNTLLIDLDFRRHSVNSTLGISNEPGVANFLLGQHSIEECIRSTDIPNLHVISSGELPAHCMGALNPAKMREILASLKPHYDVILIDSPPILGISDAAVIVHEVDITLLVIQHRRYPRNISARAQKAIEEVQGRLGGVVLNKVHLRSDESYYYYTSYYGYDSYYKSGSRKEARKRAKENKKIIDKHLRTQQANDRQSPESY
jgi:capsular exopolysaccharide synthesis family protein